MLWIFLAILLVSIVIGLPIAFGLGVAALVMAVPIVVVYRGGDALSICFNTVAVLFLSEVE